VDFAVVAPYLGLVAALALGVWQARARSGGDISIEAGESLLRQYEAQTRELRDAQREARRAEWAYLDLLAWGIRVQQQVAQEAPGVRLAAMPRRAVNGHAPQDTPTDKGEVSLRETLADRLDADDLRTLAYDLGCKALREGTVDEMTLALLDHVRTRQKWAELRAWLAEHRPDIEF
jgi:hypothetical protein